MSKSKKITLGTKEWADSNVNCYFGCSNNCQYCYAKKMSKSKKITLGTKEWADSNVNCYFGCSNNCQYCYAKKMSIRLPLSFSKKLPKFIPLQIP